MDFAHWAMAVVGVILLLLAVLIHWAQSMSGNTWKFTLLLVIAVLLIAYGFGAPR